MDSRAIYQDVCRKLAEITTLDEITGLLQWDQEVVMPRGAAPSRGRQCATLAVLRHQRATDPALGEQLEALSAVDELAQVEAANVREALRDWRRAARLPEDLVRRWGEATVAAHEIWVDARAADDFDRFAPALAELVELARARAAAIDPDAPAYDVFIDEYEPGMTMARLTPLFDRLKDFLVPFIARVRADGVDQACAWTRTPVAVADQVEVARHFIAAQGYSFDCGRVDTAVHPFCGGAGVTDVRITTRYKEDGFLGSLLAAVHETGHALYEQGRDANLAAQPVSRARSMGMHEGQSLLWEKQIARSRPFWQHWLPWLRGRYAHLAEVPLEEFLFGINRVDFGNLIRVDADELTYPLHVTMRYEIERDLLNGSLQVAHVPQVWNDAMQRYLGVTPPGQADGALQDIHWSMGAFGYFPSYTLGALYAAQIHAAVSREIPDLATQVALGNTTALRAWLSDRIHRQGSILETDALCTAATGAPLDPEPFIHYATAKYSALYRLA